MKQAVEQSVDIVKGSAAFKELEDDHRLYEVDVEFGAKKKNLHSSF